MKQKSRVNQANCRSASIWSNSLEYNLTAKGMLATRRFLAIREPIELLFKLVGIPLICLTSVFIAVLYILGGLDLLRFALNQLTWKVAFKVVAGLALVTWIRHLTWYRNEPPPIWWRRSIWLNVFEIFVLLGLVFLGIWLMLRFAR